MKSLDPTAEVVWAVDKRFAGVPKLCGSIDHVIELDGSVGSWGRQVRALGKFDFALDMQGLAKSAWVVANAKAGRKLGYHWQREGSALASGKVWPDPTSLHVVDQYIDVARAAGATVGTATFDLNPAEEDIEVMSERLVDAGWDGTSKIVLCNAGAGWATKRWAPENFAFVAEKVREAGGQVAFLGTEGDRPAYAAVQEADKGETIDMLGKSNVRQLVALVSLSSVHLAGDTGSTHIAAALGKPAVGVYTLTNPVRCCPYLQFDRCASLEAGAVADETVRLLTA